MRPETLGADLGDRKGGRKLKKLPSQASFTIVQGPKASRLLVTQPSNHDSLATRFV